MQPASGRPKVYTSLTLGVARSRGGGHHMELYALAYRFAAYHPDAVQRMCAALRWRHPPMTASTAAVAWLTLRSASSINRLSFATSSAASAGCGMPDILIRTL